MALIVGGTNPPFPSPERKPSSSQPRILNPKDGVPVSTAPQFIILRLVLAGLTVWAAVHAFLMFRLGKSAMHETSAWVATLVSVVAFSALAIVEAIRQGVACLRED